MQTDLHFTDTRLHKCNFSTIGMSMHVRCQWLPFHQRDLHQGRSRNRHLNSVGQRLLKKREEAAVGGNAVSAIAYQFFRGINKVIE